MLESLFNRVTGLKLFEMRPQQWCLPVNSLFFLSNFKVLCRFYVTTIMENKFLQEEVVSFLKFFVDDWQNFQKSIPLK